MKAIQFLVILLLLCSPTAALANESTILDEAVYCNEQIEWGERCFVRVQCHGYISGAVFVQQIPFPDESFLNVGWGFEYLPNNDPYLGSFLCEGWDTLLRPKWNPKFDMKCKGPHVKEPQSMVRVTVDLSNCEYDWVQPIDVCPCWDEIELQAVTAANVNEYLSCATGVMSYAYPDVAILQSDFSQEGLNTAFQASAPPYYYQDVPKCYVSDQLPGGLTSIEITDEELAVCIGQIADRCADIGNPFVSPN